jgi:hypothetical protein
VPREGVEPSRLSALDLKSSVAAITPPGHIDNFKFNCALGFLNNIFGGAGGICTHE